MFNQTPSSLYDGVSCMTEMRFPRAVLPTDWWMARSSLLKEISCFPSIIIPYTHLLVKNLEVIFLSTHWSLMLLMVYYKGIWRAVLYIFIIWLATAGAWPCCSSRSDCDILLSWFSCAVFVLSEHDIKMTASLEVYTKDKQYAVMYFLLSEVTEGEDIHQWLGAWYGQNCLPEWNV